MNVRSKGIGHLLGTELAPRRRPRRTSVDMGDSMKSSVVLKRSGTAAVTSLALILSTTAVATATVFDATPVSAFATSTWTPPSSDPSGITFVPGKGLLISDAEVEETPPLGLGQPTNLFYSSLAGVNNGASDDGSTVGWSNEPTGVFYVAKAGNPGTATCS